MSAQSPRRCARKAAYTGNVPKSSFTLRSWLFCVVILIPFTCFAEERPIVVVHSYHKEYSWVQEINRGISDYHIGKSLFGVTPIAAFGKHPIEYLFMGAKSYQGNNRKLQEIGQQIAQGLRKHRPIVTLVSDDEALQYVAVPLRHDASQRFVFLAVNEDPRKYGLASNYQSPDLNITGLISEHPFVYSIRLLTQIVPHYRHIHIFLDDSVSGRGIYQNLLQHIPLLPEAIARSIGETTISNDWSLWKRKILQYQNSSDVFIFGTFYSLRDEHGRLVPETDVIRWIVQHSHVPELSITSSHIKDGLLLSIANPGYVHGYMACHKAAQIVEGVPIEKLPIETPPQKAVHVNMRRAKEVGVVVPVNVIATSKYFDQLGY